MPISEADVQASLHALVDPNTSRDFVSAKAYVFEKCERLFQARGNKKISRRWHAANKNFKCGAGVKTGFDITGCHRQFV